MNGILDFVEEGELNRLFDEEGDIDEDIKDSDDVYIEEDDEYDEYDEYDEEGREEDDYDEELEEYDDDDDDDEYDEELERELEQEQERKEEREDSLIRRYTAADIAKLFKDRDNEKLEGIAIVLGMSLKSLKSVNTRKNNKKKLDIKGPTGPEYIAKNLREVNKKVDEII
jgi:hypothetical protein